MRLRFLTCAFLLVLVPPASGQELVVQRNAQTHAARLVEEDMWVFEMDQEDYFILKRSVVDTLTKRIAQKDAIIQRHERVLAAQDTLLRRYEEFDLAATAHVDTLEALASLADSLFVGYKSLYTDLKELLGISSLAVSGGFGAMSLAGDRVRLMGVVGVGYHDWWGQVQLGRGYRGVAAGIRVPLGF